MLMQRPLLRQWYRVGRSIPALYPLCRLAIRVRRRVVSVSDCVISLLCSSSTGLRQYGQAPVKKFGEITGCKTIPGRFIPGTLTNPTYHKFIEPKIIVVTDPRSDAQAVLESKQNGIPVVGLCDTENLLTNVDIVVPVNNKGRKAIALVYWLLARQLLRERGTIGPEDELDIEAADFELKF